MGSLLDAIDDIPENRGGTPHYIDVWLETLSDEDRVEAVELLKDKRFGHSRIARVIERAHGKRFEAGAVGSYRRSRGYWTVV